VPITSVTIDRRNIFDVNDSTFWALKIVNALHIPTRTPFIRRELLFAPGQPYDSASVAESGRNLRLLGVFSDVRIDTVRSDSGMAINVMTRDGWSTRPDFRFHSTGGSLAYTFALIEENLLGTMTQAQLLYQKDPDRTSKVAFFNRPRLIDGKIGTTLEYADQSDGKFFTGQLGLPYYSLSSRDEATVDFTRQDGRVLRYRFGSTVAHDTLERQYVLGRIDIGHALRASPRGYVRIGLLGQIRRDDYDSASNAVLLGVNTQTLSGAFGGYIEWRHAQYLPVHGYESFARQEDVDLSQVVRVSALIAPRGLGYDRDGIAPGLGVHSGLRLPGGFAFADLTINGLFQAGGLDSGQVLLGGTAVFLPGHRHEFLLHAEAGAIRNPAPGSEFDLGFGVGPRAFVQHAFTGDREFFTTAEYRYTLWPEAIKLTGIGVAVFADDGGAWWANDGQRTGSDFGIGLRIGPSRTPDVEATRIDFARRIGNDAQPGGWVLIVGKGFAFTASPRGGR
jgi:hypothetical protein